MTVPGTVDDAIVVFQSAKAVRDAAVAEQEATEAAAVAAQAAAVVAEDAYNAALQQVIDAMTATS